MQEKRKNFPNLKVEYKKETKNSVTNRIQGGKVSLSAFPSMLQLPTDDVSEKGRLL